MLKLKKLQEAKALEGSRPISIRKPSLIRLKRDLENIDLSSKICEIEEYLAESPMRLNVSIKPDDGFYRGGKYLFNIIIKDTYPIEPPSVKCLQRIYHPNIDIEGNVCLNLLREDWTPALDLQTILIGILYLFYEPNGKDPLNKEAAKKLMDDPSRFAQIVEHSLKGANIDGVWYDKIK